MKRNGKWETIATVGYHSSVNPQNENRAAHGAVCHLQARKSPTGNLLGRRINSNGRHQEISESFPLSLEQLETWKAIERTSR